MYTPFKMKGKSPMMKALIGKQNNLPAGLKAKILASPTKMYDKKSPTKANGEKGNKITDALNKVYETVTPNYLQKTIEKVYDKGKDMYDDYKQDNEGINEGLKVVKNQNTNKTKKQNKKTKKTSKPLQSDAQSKKIINSLRGKLGDGSDKSNFVNKVVSKGGASTQNKKESTTLENLTTTKKSMATKKKKAAPKYKKPAPIKNYKKGYYGA